MGSLLLDDDPDIAHPIAGVAVAKPIEIMWIVREGQRWIFKEEIEGTYDVHSRGVARGDYLQRWHRREISVPAKNRVIRAGHHLVLAEHPYSVGQVETALFKRSSHHGERNRPEPPEEVIVSLTATRNWAEGQLNDLWASGDFLTAGLSQPQPPLNPHGRRYRRRLLVFGACVDCAQIELDMHLDKHLQRLLEWTEKNTIEFWYDFVNPEPTTDPPKLGLKPQVKVMGPKLMEHAIKLARAGPHENSAGWFDEPFTKLVDYVYRGLLNQYNRVEEP